MNNAAADIWASDSASSSGPRTPSSVSSGFERGSPSSERYHPYGGETRKSSSSSPIGAEPGRRRRWSHCHALEKVLFTVTELQTLGVPQRRPILITSLEAHIDRLHAQLFALGAGFYPVTPEELARLKGMNARTCKAMVSSLHNDVVHGRERLLQLERTNQRLEAALYAEH
ncbi:hypothetical protein K438DRAFT_1800162 [Mycena galopus ATCC 62051]|nr:hypothetical protein K438DRAFT_1800162 [Mycena galopus ATCC 62051]